MNYTKIIELKFFNKNKKSINPFIPLVILFTKENDKLSFGFGKFDSMIYSDRFNGNKINNENFSLIGHFFIRIWGKNVHGCITQDTIFICDKKY